MTSRIWSIFSVAILLLAAYTYMSAREKYDEARALKAETATAQKKARKLDLLVQAVAKSPAETFDLPEIGYKVHYLKIPVFDPKERVNGSGFNQPPNCAIFEKGQDFQVLCGVNIFGSTLSFSDEDEYSTVTEIGNPRK